MRASRFDSGPWLHFHWSHSSNEEERLQRNDVILKCILYRSRPKGSFRFVHNVGLKMVERKVAGSTPAGTVVLLFRGMDWSWFQHGLISRSTAVQICLPRPFFNLRSVSSGLAYQAHNLEVTGSNPVSATILHVM